MENSQEPLSVAFTSLSKQFYGVVTKRLASLPIDRYFYTMVLIHRNNGKISQKELSELICTDKVFMVKVLDYLAEKKMVRRVVNQKDRREHLISLTAKGEKCIPSIEKAIQQANEDSLKGFSLAEKELFYRLLQKMSGNLNRLPAAEVGINFKKIK